MRWVLLLLLLPSVAGLTVDDPEGDVEHTVADQEVTPAETPHVDLVSLQVAEADDAFAFVLSMAQPPPDGQVLDSHAFEIHANVREQAYVMVIFQSADLPGATSAQVDLLRSFADGAEWLASTSAERDGASLSWSFGRGHFIGAAGAPVTRGDAMDLYVEMRDQDRVEAGPVGSPMWYRYDRMPDQGVGVLVLQTGLEQDGALLASREPFRATNGFAGTFAVNVSLQAERPGVFQIGAEGVPDGWEVRIPHHEVDLDAGGRTAFDVFITVPFAHAHGTSESFILQARSDDAIGRLEIGLHFVETPQPSGHHDRIWIHAGPGFQDALGIADLGRSRDTSNAPFMNTVEDDARDMGGTIEPTSGSTVSYGPGSYEATWTIPLDPGLRMGLNVTATTTPFELRIDSPVAREIRVVGVLEVREDGQWRPVATARAGPTTIDGTTAVGGEVEGEAQVVPYAMDLALRLVLTVRSDDPGLYNDHTAPYLLAGSWLELPLAEYDDQTPPALQEVGHVDSRGAAVGPGRDSPAPGAVLILAIALALKRRLA